VIDKPAGLPVDRPRDGSIALENHLANLTFGFQRWPTAVHRLDRDTSGCLLLARNPKAHARFQQAFEAGNVTKRYIAVIDGVPDAEAGLIDLPLIKVSSAERGWRMTGDPKGKAARTCWRQERVGHSSPSIPRPAARIRSASMPPKDWAFRSPAIRSMARRMAAR
jgi:tRNA pseudouridine32 synthase/23S rRNA pseudouridine746 synthase